MNLACKHANPDLPAAALTLDAAHLFPEVQTKLLQALLVSLPRPVAPLP
jgi:hypothetical protein